MYCVELTEATLREHFEGCGAVTAVRLIRDKNTGLGKGFGYILFEVRASHITELTWPCERDVQG